MIDRPHRLVMTWTFDDEPANEQLIELSFSESDGSTTVLMVNSAIVTRGAPRRTRTAAGARAWTSSSGYW